MAGAASERLRHVDDLPDEWFTQILDHVPIRDIFVLKRVSERWAAACRYIVRERESLIVGNDSWYRRCSDRMRGWDWHKNRPTELNNITVPSASLLPAMMSSLNQMNHISRLTISGISRKGTILLRKFSDQLTLLEVDFAIRVVGSKLVFPHLTHLRCSNFGAKTSASFPKLAELVIFGIQTHEKLPDIVLPSLKRLLVDFPHYQLMKDFIHANASSLEFLSVGGYFLVLYEPVYEFIAHAGVHVVFDKMIELQCGSMPVDKVTAFPAIRRLSLRRGVTGALLHNLPADQMLSLHIELEEKAYEEEDQDIGLKACAPVIAEMNNLKELDISLRFATAADQKMCAIHALSSMFDQLHQLQKVSIISNFAHSVQSRFNGDSVMYSLVQENPNLRDIHFRGFYFTAAAFASLAQLHHMSHISLELYSGVDSDIKTHAVLMLIRGCSRRVIRQLKVWGPDLDVDQVTREVELVAQERGTTFEFEEFTKVYKIHV